jgi:dTDP-glucose pyrophosphorylase
VLNIVIPMAGRGGRFRDAGYMLPKPLIPVLGRPMIRVVIDNVRPSCPHRFIFINLRENVESHGIDRLLTEWAPGCVTITLDGVTEGAACTVLMARDAIDSDDPLMIANCDQWVDHDIDDYLAELNRAATDGLIMTMWADDPKWSYVRLDAQGRATEVVEKQVVSNAATVGIYNFRRGADFVRAAERMIAKNLRVNAEFYVAPAYNELLAEGKSIALYDVGRESDGMYGLGIPSDLRNFEGLPVARKAVGLG